MMARGAPSISALRARTTRQSASSGPKDKLIRSRESLSVNIRAATGHLELLASAKQMESVAEIGSVLLRLLIECVSSGWVEFGQGHIHAFIVFIELVKVALLRRRLLLGRDIDDLSCAASSSANGSPTTRARMLVLLRVVKRRDRRRRLS